MWLARDHLKEKLIVATRAPMFVVLGAICGVGTDPARTFAALHFATRGVGGGCPWRARLLAKRVTVRPSFALVVAVQPMRGVARHALPEPIDWASQPRGARAMLALAFFAAPALRIRGVRCGLLLDLTLFITILPRKTRSIIQIVFALARNTFLAALHGTRGTSGGRTVFADAASVTAAHSITRVVSRLLERFALCYTICPRLALRPIQEVLAAAGNTLGVVILRTSGVRRAHATVRTRASFRSPAHRVLSSGASCRLDFADLVAISVWFACAVVKVEF